MDDQQLQAMIQQKLKEMNEQQIQADQNEINSCKQKITEIKKSFNEMKSNNELSKFDKESAIKDAVFALAAINQQLEEHQYFVSRYGEHYKQEREKGNLQIQQLTQYRQLLEENCRKMQADNKKIKEGNISMKEKNDADRISIIENCEKSVQEFRDKITQQEEENKKLEEDNLKLREELKEKIQEHEENQKKAEQQRADKDEQSNESQKKLQEEYSKIEENAREAIDIQKQNSESFKSCQEMKVQIVYYRDKIHEFEQSLEKSKEFLDVVIREIGKLGVKFKPFSEKKQKLEEKANIGDTIIISYLNHNNESKSIISELSKQKVQQQSICKKLQEEYQAKLKQQQ